MTDTADDSRIETLDASAGALMDALVALKDATEAKAFLTDLLTPAELRVLAERWLVARLLDDSDLSYRGIAERAATSTTTVVRVARFLRDEPHQGYRLMLDRMKDKS